MEARFRRAVEQAESMLAAARKGAPLPLGLVALLAHQLRQAVTRLDQADAWREGSLRTHAVALVDQLDAMEAPAELARVVVRARLE
jgi:hypothetical protein